MSTAHKDGNPRRIGQCPTCGARDGAGCTGAPFGGVHAARLRANNIAYADVPGYLQALRRANARRA
jgi:hypothetical protein